MQSSNDGGDFQALVEKSGGFQPWRRVFHAACGITIASALLTLRPSRDEAVLVLGIVVALQLAGDLFRLAVPRLNEFFFRSFSRLVTPREQDRIASSTWYVMGALLAVAFFPLVAAAGGILVLALADPAANVVGRRWGRIPLGKNGTLAGTAAFLATAFLTLLLLAPPLAAGGGAVAASLVERLVRQVDDNLTIPLAAAAALWALGVA